MGEQIRVAIKAQDLMTPVLRQSLGFLRRWGSVAVRTFKNVAGGATRILRALTSLKSILTGLIFFAAARGLLGFVTNVAEAGDQVQKLNVRLGLSTELLSELRFAADRSGVDFRTLSLGLQRAVRRMEEFRQTGGGPAAEGFQILGGGIAQAVAQGQSLEQLLPRIADQFAGLQSEQQAVLAAMRLFDSEGVRLVQLLREGGEGIEELRRQARELGLSFSQEDAQRAAAFTDALTNFSSALQGLNKEIVLQFFPIFTRQLETLTKFITDNRATIVNFFIDLGIQSVNAAEAVVEGTERVANAIIKLTNFVSGSTSKPGLLDTIEGQGGTLRDVLRQFGVDIQRPSEPIAPLNLSAQAGPAFARLRAQLEAGRRQSGRLGPAIPAEILEAGRQARSGRGAGGIDIDTIAEQAERAGDAFGLREGLAKAIQDAHDESQKLGLALQQVIGQGQRTLASGLADAFVDIASGVQRADEAFRRFAQNFLTSVARMIAEAAILKAVQAGVGSIPLGGGGGPTVTSASASAAGGAARGGIFAGPLHRMALGGVLRARTFLAGPFGAVEARERGQNEAFVPLPDNRSIPVRFQNRQGGGAGGGVTIIEQNTFEIRANDQRGFRELLQQEGELVSRMVLTKKRRSLAMSEGLR